MPPKKAAKTSKPTNLPDTPKPTAQAPDPLAHLSTAERQKLLKQARKLLPNGSLAGDDDDGVDNDGAGKGGGGSLSEDEADVPVLDKGKGKRGGRARGSAGYTKEDEWTLVGAINKSLPRSEAGWKRTAAEYNRTAAIQCSEKELKKRKPTSDAEGSVIHDTFLAANALLQAQEET
ncbi:hypothetical protein V565_235330, partial [Rhizoctonia solani 123E]